MSSTLARHWWMQDILLTKTPQNRYHPVGRTLERCQLPGVGRYWSIHSPATCPRILGEKGGPPCGAPAFGGWRCDLLWVWTFLKG